MSYALFSSLIKVVPGFLFQQKISFTGSRGISCSRWVFTWLSFSSNCWFCCSCFLRHAFRWINNPLLVVNPLPHILQDTLLWLWLLSMSRLSLTLITLIWRFLLHFHFVVLKYLKDLVKFYISGDARFSAPISEAIYLEKAIFKLKIVHFAI